LTFVGDGPELVKGFFASGADGPVAFDGDEDVRLFGQRQRLRKYQLAVLVNRLQRLGHGRRVTVRRRVCKEAGSAWAISCETFEPQLTSCLMYAEAFGERKVEFYNHGPSAQPRWVWRAAGGD